MADVSLLAAKLKTPRVITVTGQNFSGKGSFDGSGDITIATADTRTAGTLSVYVSKASGLDTNDGLTPETPVQTIERALAIADHRMLPGLLSFVFLCIDKGPWGNVSFSRLPWPVHIFPFSEEEAEEYSEDLPVFETLFLTGASVVTYGMVCDTVEVTGKSVLSVNGFVRAGGIVSQYGAVVGISASVIEVGAEPTGRENADVISVGKQGSVILYHGETGTQKVSLVGNRTGTGSFLAVDDQGIALLPSDIAVEVAEGCSLAGKKYVIGGDCTVSTGEGPGATTLLDKLPGTQEGTVEEGATINGAHVLADKSIGINGNAATATKLKTGRAIKLTGTVTGTGTFDGSTDVSIATTVPTMTAATNTDGDVAGVNGKAGLVPAPAAGAANRYLRSDATWAVPPNTTYTAMTKATADAAGKAGLVPAPAAGAQAKFLRGDATWQVPTNTTYANVTGATSTAAGKAGLVPAPGSNVLTQFLKSTGKWAAPLGSEVMTTVNYATTFTNALK